MRFKSFMLIPMVVFLIGCGEKSEPKREFNPVIPVKISVVDLLNDSNFRNYVGSVKSEMKLALSFPMGGTLTGIYVHNGQKVKKGDIIAKVDETTAKSLHDAALATLNQAEDGYTRLKQVHEEGGISEVRWVQMETDLEKARQTEISTRKHLEDCTIYALQDGVVSMDSHVIGEQLRPTETFCYILNMDKLIVEFSVPEKEIGLINVGDKAEASLPSLNDVKKSIEILDKSLISNPFGHTYNVKARISLDAKELLPGMVAKVSVMQTAMKGIVVPASCVQTTADGIALWTIENGKSYRRKIEVSEFVKNGVLVTYGLNYGDTIVTEGYQKLYNGAKVSFK